MTTVGERPVSSFASRLAQSFWEFKAAVAESFVPLEVRSDATEHFRGRVHSTFLGQITISKVSATTHEVHRTPELIAQSDRHYYKLSLQLDGNGLFVQNNREYLLRPGDMTIYSTDKPYSLCFEENFHALVVMLPQRLLNLPPELVNHLNAERFPADDVLASVVAPFLTRVASSADQLTVGATTGLARTVVDLVTTMLSERLGFDPAGADRHQPLVNRIKEYIHANLSCTHLAPNQIAQVHFISTRHLHELFREQGTTVSGWIRSQRLERCHRDLLDSTLRHEPIATIAARWGFTDAAHFSRIFKRAYATSPSALRRLAAGGMDLDHARTGARSSCTEV